MAAAQKKQKNGSSREQCMDRLQICKFEFSNGTHQTRGHHRVPAECSSWLVAILAILHHFHRCSTYFLVHLDRDLDVAMPMGWIRY